MCKFFKRKVWSDSFEIWQEWFVGSRPGTNLIDYTLCVSLCKPCLQICFDRLTLNLVHNLIVRGWMPWGILYREISTVDSVEIVGLCPKLIHDFIDGSLNMAMFIRLSTNMVTYREIKTLGCCNAKYPLVNFLTNFLSSASADRRVLSWPVPPVRPSTCLSVRPSVQPSLSHYSPQYLMDPVHIWYSPWP